MWTVTLVYHKPKSEIMNNVRYTTRQFVLVSFMAMVFLVVVKIMKVRLSKRKSCQR